jgi:transcriptional regulator with XRE-family HTH domain
MTKLGIYLTQRSVNKAEIGRRTGLGRQRIGELCNNDSTRLGAEELYRIALAINVDPGEIFKEVFKDIGLGF